MTTTNNNMDKIRVGEKVYGLKNPFNSGGIEATLKRWYADKSPANLEKWVNFDGVSVLLADRPINNEQFRSLGTVSDLGSIFDQTAHLTLDEFLHNDF